MFDYRVGGGVLKRLTLLLAYNSTARLTHWLTASLSLYLLYFIRLIIPFGYVVSLDNILHNVQLRESFFISWWPQRIEIYLFKLWQKVFFSVAVC